MANEPEITMPKSPEVYLFGEIEVKSFEDDRLRMSGFVSTPSPDLAREIVELDAFEEYLPFYQRNPIYCYDHDRSMPIGRVGRCEIVKTGDKTGLYLDDITLSKIPIVNEYLEPLIRDRVLTQQSIGFLSLDGSQDGRVYRHKKVFLLESSLVPIACNPTATIDQVKSAIGELPPGYHRFETLNDLVEAFEKGLLRLPSGIRKLYALGANGDNMRPTQTLDNTQDATAPDFADAVVLTAAPDRYDPDGAEVPKPHKNAKGYAATCELIYAATSETRGSYLFQIAVPTANGFRYDWHQTAMSMSRVLGGNGGAHFSREQKAAIVERIAEAYVALGKELPIAEYADGAVAVDTLLPECLEALAYKDVTFRSGEKDVVRLAFLAKDLEQVANTLQSYVKDGEPLPPEVREIVGKALYGYVDISMFASVSDTESLSFLTSVMQMINEYMGGTDGDASDDGTIMSGPDGLRKFAEYLMSKTEAPAEAEPESKSADHVVLLPGDLLREYLSLLDVIQR